MKKALFILLLLLGTLRVSAQDPLYIVNGEPRDEIASIPPDQIERVETLPADEESIALYGPQAAHGVMLITLCYDQPARFPSEQSFTDYIASQVSWPVNEPAARVILRYIITAEGELVIDKELESTDSRLKRRVVKALEESPRWEPASKNGTPVPTQGVVRIQLPVGREVPRKAELVWR